MMALPKLTGDDLPMASVPLKGPAMDLLENRKETDNADRFTEEELERNGLVVLPPRRKFVPQTISLNIVRRVLGEEEFRAFEEGVKRYKEARAEERRRETLARKNALKAKQEEHRARMEKIKRDREERLRLVADLRRQGYSYGEIALAVGIPDSRAEQGDVPTWAQDDNVLRSDISTRAKNALSAADIWSFADLTDWSKGELLDLPGFGRKSLNEISEVLMQMGLEFKPGGPPQGPSRLPRRYRPPKPESG